MRFLYSLAVVIALLCALTLISCSRSGLPSEPSINDQDLPSTSLESTGNRHAIAVYDAVIDPVAQTFTITPERISSYHFPLSNSIAKSLSITGFGWAPTFWADIKITHPYPGSGITVFDPRVIAIIPASSGYSFNYPNLGVTGNNSVVYQPDGYTELFDGLGGGIPGNCNPFKAYMKTMPYRAWLSYGSKTSETQRWYMNLTGFGGPATYKLVLDVSTNYPAPAQQIIDNCPEPIQGRIDVTAGMTPQGGGGFCYVYLTDWQGEPSISRVSMEAPQLYNGYTVMIYQGPGPNPNELCYWCWIFNTLLAPEGTYKIMAAATDSATGIRYLYEGTLEIKPPFPSNPTDATPQKVNWSPEDMVMGSNFLFVASGINGMNIFDVNNQYMNWYNSYKTAGCDIRVLDYSDGYCYALDYANNKLYVINVHPGYAILVKTVDLPATPYDIDISTDGYYAFVADGSSGIQIVDITVPDSANIVKNVPTTDSARSVAVTSEYAYVADYSSGLQILDITTILNSFIANTVTTPYPAIKVAESGIYVYVLDEISGMSVVEAVPVNTAAIVNTVLFPDAPKDLIIYDNYAYIADNMYNLEIVDITDPITASLFSSADTPLWAQSIIKSNNFVWVADKQAGIEIYDVNIPGSPTLVNTYRTPGATKDVHVVGDYIYTAEDIEGFQIFNRSSDPSAPIFDNSFNPASNVVGMDIEGDYAVLGCSTTGIAIYGVTPPGTETYLNTIDTPGIASEIDVVGDYAYVADRDAGLTIVKINPPSAAYIVKTVDTPGLACDVSVFGNYAYVADNTGGLQIISINPPATASIVNTVAMPDLAWGVDYANGYAYVADYASGLQIVDVDPVNTASIVKSVDTPGLAYGVFVYFDFAFVADGPSGLQNIWINPLNSAAIFSSADTPGTALDVYVKSEFAYVADDRGGLRAIRLW